MTNTNIRLNNNNINSTDVIAIHVSYGKNRTFVSHDYVEGNALDKYISEWVTIIRNRGWDKTITFAENMTRMVKTDDVKEGKIRCYTADGYKTIRVAH